MGKKIQVSASHSDQLLQCGYAFATDLPEEEEEAGEDALYGLAFHEVQAKVLVSPKIVSPAQVEKWAESACEKFDVPSLSEEVSEHVVRSTPVLFKFLSGDNAFRLTFDVTAVEKAYALDTVTTSGRVCAPFDEKTHVYPDVLPGEVPGTLDLQATTTVRVKKDRVLRHLVLDHKSGEQDWGSGDFSRPGRLPQILTLAAAVGLEDFETFPDVMYGATFHSPRRGMPKAYLDEIEKDELKEHVGKMRSALERVGDRSLRPGPCCRFCKARPVCPAGSYELLAQAQGVLEQAGTLVKRDTTNLTSPEKIGKLHLLVTEADRVVKAARSAMKQWVKDHPDEIPVRPDNKMLYIQKFPVERLSKERFVEAYGKVAAEKLFARWRKDGALVSVEEERLAAEKAE